MPQYGSLINLITDKPAAVIPELGMGATVLGYSDRRAFTIVEILSPCRIVIQRDTAIRTDDNGMSDCQSYNYERNTLGARHVVSRRRDGRWKIAKEGTTVSIGQRAEYYDYSF